MFTDDEKYEIVDSYLSALDSRKISGRDWGLQKYYWKLNHPKLEIQLSSWIENLEYHLLARDAAIDITEVCAVRGLQPILLEVIFNSSEASMIREAAIRTINKIGDINSKKSLVPLVLTPIKNDPNFQLRGYAYRALWPDHISARRVFRNLKHSGRIEFRGSYAYFIGHDLIQKIKINDLPIALRWLKRVVSRRRLDYDFERLSD